MPSQTAAVNPDMSAAADSSHSPPPASHLASANDQGPPAAQGCGPDDTNAAQGMEVWQLSGSALQGARVQVQRGLQWIDGTVVSYDGSKCQHSVTFDGYGSSEWLLLPAYHTRLLECAPAATQRLLPPQLMATKAALLVLADSLNSGAAPSSYNGGCTPEELRKRAVSVENLARRKAPLTQAAALSVLTSSPATGNTSNTGLPTAGQRHLSKLTSIKRKGCDGLAEALLPAPSSNHLLLKKAKQTGPNLVGNRQGQEERKEACKGYLANSSWDQQTGVEERREARCKPRKSDSKGEAPDVSAQVPGMAPRCGREKHDGHEGKADGKGLKINAMPAAKKDIPASKKEKKAGPAGCLGEKPPHAKGIKTGLAGTMCNPVDQKPSDVEEGAGDALKEQVAEVHDCQQPPHAKPAKKKPKMRTMASLHQPQQQAGCGSKGSGPAKPRFEPKLRGPMEELCTSGPPLASLDELMTPSEALYCEAQMMESNPENDREQVLSTRREAMEAARHAKWLAATIAEVNLCCDDADDSLSGWDEPADQRMSTENGSRMAQREPALSNSEAVASGDDMPLSTIVSRETVELEPPLAGAEDGKGEAAVAVSRKEAEVEQTQEEEGVKEAKEGAEEVKVGELEPKKGVEEVDAGRPEGELLDSEVSILDGAAAAAEDAATGGVAVASEGSSPNEPVVHMTKAVAALPGAVARDLKVEAAGEGHGQADATTAEESGAQHGQMAEEQEQADEEEQEEVDEVQEEEEEAEEETPAQEITSARFRTVDTTFWKPRALVGLKVMVFWPADSKWYEGKIKGFDERRYTHTVNYDDGDVEELVLVTEKLRMLGRQILPTASDAELKMQARVLQDLAEALAAGSDKENVGGKLSSGREASRIFQHFPLNLLP
eukprot:CAMPEP_0117665646 /NCGR_PEP_ID=MMETSP0804-20121206/9929_1 /TAXON_ID=1074897 /ORGANISM="Tetraselmis astigmatica, Strain CCMP880" /LENGTH=889 /DNA_ID=CAMNT_0005473089 /DNA_START=211 /DNA_END=2881 /DNA_ORIENTATION=-